MLIYKFVLIFLCLKYFKKWFENWQQKQFKMIASAWLCCQILLKDITEFDSKHEYFQIIFKQKGFTKFFLGHLGALKAI